MRRAFYFGPLLGLALLGLTLPTALGLGVGTGAPPRPTPLPHAAPVAAPRTASFVGGLGPVRTSDTPPPPPFDWDPMWFNTDNASSSAPDWEEAGGAFTALSVSDATRSALMFGGEVPGARLTNQTWIVNQTTAVWHLYHPVPAPRPRMDFSLSGTAACGVAVLFGGVVDPSTNQATNDTWLFNFTTRHWLNITGPVGPAPREGAAIAADAGRCEALLYGGINEDYRSGNSTGSVRWNDTWLLNLTTHVWSPVPVSATPPSVTDAGLLYDNATGLYLLYGGCEGGLCSPDVWSFDPVTSLWTLVTGSNPFLPQGRGGANWVYSPTWNIAILSSGYALEGSSTVALNDTWTYLISDNRFEEVGTPTPLPRYGAAGGWLSANGCPGFLLLGGAQAPSDPPDEWFMDPAPDIPLACNTWGNDSISTGGGGIGCDQEYTLTVTVDNATSGLPLAGATVTVDGNCSRAVEITPTNGTVDFEIAWQPYIVSANLTFYHANATSYTPILPLLNGTLLVNLTPLPTLVVQTLLAGQVGAPPVPLGDVYLTTGDLVPLGESNPEGVYERAGYEPPGAVETFTGNKTNYSTDSVTVPIPYTGIFAVNLTLLGPGPFEVRVSEIGGGPLAGVRVVVAAAPGTPSAGFTAETSPSGWANATLVAGNYTATAMLSGFERIGFSSTVSHPWATATFVQINLTAKVGYEVDARVFDDRTKLPIAGASVQVGVFAPETTSASGWANRTNITPAGTYGVIASAANYSSNRTSVILDFENPIWIVHLNLTPLRTSCTGPGPGCSPATHNQTQIVPLTLWPSGPPSAALVIGGGALLVIVPAAYLWGSRRRSAASPGARSP